jgi:tetratricopeptide (TPR) repeat protein
MIAPRRNDPCPCGSGLKYKKCCMSSQASFPAPGDPHAELRSQAYKEMAGENWSQAIFLFKKLIQVGPQSYGLLEAVASCQEGLDNYLAAGEYYEKALGLCPNSRKPELWYRLGVARACAGRMEKAADAFRTCLELQSDPRIRDKIGQLLATVEEILAGDKEPHLFQVHVQLQRAFSDMEAERFQAAAERLQTIAEIEPDNPAIFYNLGVVYTFLKREDEALESFRLAVELHPGYAEAWYNMGQIYLIRKKDFSRALNCFDRAASIRPDYIGAHHQKGIAYELIGDREKACKCWEKTLELDPGNKQAQESLARLQGMPRGAVSPEKRKDL